MEDVRSAVSFQSPDFHFPEALAPKASLATQRLLGDQRVRTCASSMDLVVDQVVEFEHVDVSDGGLLLHFFAGSTVEESDFSVPWQACGFECIVDDFFGCTVENRCDGLEAEHGAGPSQVGFKNLTYVHAARNPKRIEHDLDRCTIWQERHVLDR